MVLDSVLAGVAVLSWETGPRGGLFGHSLAYSWPCLRAAFPKHHLFSPAHSLLPTFSHGCSYSYDSTATAILMSRGVAAASGTVRPGR